MKLKYLWFCLCLLCLSPFAASFVVGAPCRKAAVAAKKPVVNPLEVRVAKLEATVVELTDGLAELQAQVDKLHVVRVVMERVDCACDVTGECDCEDCDCEACRCGTDCGCGQEDE